ncbi:hypothetical protein, partial [Leptolyngbya sp. FACHB-16]
MAEYLNEGDVSLVTQGDVLSPQAFPLFSSSNFHYQIRACKGNVLILRAQKITFLGDFWETISPLFGKKARRSRAFFPNNGE